MIVVCDTDIAIIPDFGMEVVLNVVEAGKARAIAGAWVGCLIFYGSKRTMIGLDTCGERVWFAEEDVRSVEMARKLPPKADNVKAKVT